MPHHNAGPDRSADRPVGEQCSPGRTKAVGGSHQLGCWAVVESDVKLALHCSALSYEERTMARPTSFRLPEELLSRLDDEARSCLLYTSDAADDLTRVDL